MILYIAEGMAKKLSSLYTEYMEEAGATKDKSHKCSLTYTQDVNREITKVDPQNRNVSFLKVVDIDPETNGQEGQRRNRRLVIRGRTTDGKGVEELRVAPVILRVTWFVPLFKGVQEYWEILKVLMAVKQGKANFTLKVAAGAQEIPVEIRPVMQGSLPPPPLEGDVQEQQIPMIEVQMSIPNAYIIMNKHDEGLQPTLQVLSVSPTGDPADSVDYVGDENSIT